MRLTLIAVMSLMCATCAISAFLGAAEPGVAVSPELAALREKRAALVARQRRIIANNDGCDCLYFPKDQELTPQTFLDARTTALAGTTTSRRIDPPLRRASFSPWTSNRVPWYRTGLSVISGSGI